MPTLILGNESSVNFRTAMVSVLKHIFRPALTSESPIERKKMDAEVFMCKVEYMRRESCPLQWDQIEIKYVALICCCTLPVNP